MQTVYRKILIAVDGSAFSENAAIKGIALGRQLNATIAFIYVVDNSFLLGTVNSYGSPVSVLNQMREEGKAMLDHLSADMDVRPEQFLELGDPPEEILNIAAQWNADLIVMGTHGRKGVKHLLVGSVAEYVIRHSTCPVLIVPKL